MNLKKLNFDIELFLEKELTKLLPKHIIADAYHWAMFPAGKLFRPKLAMSICQDLNPDLYQSSINLENTDLLFFACALECHHSYSLVHDDLPSMDNDDMRRGKISTHKKYGEWRAILTGDGLLNISYEFISKIKKTNSNRILELIRVFSYSMGPRGLIHGQTLDLSHEMTHSFENTITTHKLKTARLIQMAILGSALISIAKNRKLEKTLWRLGENVGILFQLLDDLSELTDLNLSQHELDVNPWLRFQKETYLETSKRLMNLKNILIELKLTNTNLMLADYFSKMNLAITKDIGNIETNLENKIDLRPMIAILDTLCHLK